MHDWICSLLRGRPWYVPFCLTSGYELTWCRMCSMASERVPSDGMPGYGYYVHQYLQLGTKYRGELDFPHHDEKHHTIRHLWILCRALLLRMAVRVFLLPRGVKHDARRGQNRLPTRLWCSLCRKVEEAAEAGSKGGEDTVCWRLDSRNAYFHSDTSHHSIVFRGLFNY